MGGNSESEGRVEVCAFGEFGTVCDDRWDENDATVACRQFFNQQAFEAGEYCIYIISQAPLN